MEWVETTGRTVEDAKEAALDQLGVDAQDAEFEIVEEPRTGLFGRLRGEARVRARVKPTRPRPKVERRDRRRRSGEGRESREGRGEGRSRGGSRRSRPASTTTASAATTGGGTAAAIDQEADVEPVPTTTPGDASAAPTTPATRRRRRRGGQGRGSGGTDRAPAGDSSDNRSARKDSQEGNDMSNDASVEDQAEITSTFLAGLVEAFGYSASIAEERTDEDTIELKVEGDDLGLLIGPKGQTLQAVQELARTVVQRQATGTHHGRVRIDVAGYRQRRKEALERFATQVANDVLASGRQKALEPMHPADRKVVHDTINEIEGVSTTSEGEEPRRRVVIMPAAPTPPAE